MLRAHRQLCYLRHEYWDFTGKKKKVRLPGCTVASYPIVASKMFLVLVLLPSSRWGTGLGGTRDASDAGSAVLLWDPNRFKSTNPRFSHCWLLQVQLPLILKVPVSAGSCSPSPGTREQLDAGPQGPATQPVLPLDPAPREPHAKTSPGRGPQGLPGCPGASKPADPIISDVLAHQTISHAQAGSIQHPAGHLPADPSSTEA